MAAAGFQSVEQLAAAALQLTSLYQIKQEDKSPQAQQEDSGQAAPSIAATADPCSMAAAGFQSVEQLAAAALQLTSLYQIKQRDESPQAQQEDSGQAAPSIAAEDSDDGLDLYADLLQPQQGVPTASAVRPSCIKHIEEVSCAIQVAGPCCAANCHRCWRW
jgi:hypothetical protein